MFSGGIEMKHRFEIETFSIEMFSLDRNQSTDLHFKSIDWFLCEANIAKKNNANLAYNNLLKKLKDYDILLSF